MNPRVKKVQVKADFKLVLTFANGENRIFDVSPYLEIGVFRELKNPAYFQLVKVDNGTVVWPHNQDFCPDTLFVESKKYLPKTPKERKQYPKIAEVKPLPGKKLLVDFQNGEKKVYDCSPLLSLPVFSRLNNDGFFKNVRCDPSGYGISWNEEIDISEGELWLNGKSFLEKNTKKLMKFSQSSETQKKEIPQGFIDVPPCIKKIEFVQRGTFSLLMKDGRIITVPLKTFPSIKKLTAKQRKRWYILDGVGFSFDDCDEVFHIEQVLGDFSENKYSFVPQNKHCAEDSAPFVPVKKTRRKS